MHPPEYLAKHGLINPDTVELFWNGTRDKPDLKVMRCTTTGVIFLDKIDRPSHSWAGRLTSAQSALSVDNLRRTEYMSYAILGHSWLDVGCGNGGLRNGLKMHATVAETVEPDVRYDATYRKISDARNVFYDVVTLMHVLEHMPDPIGELKKIRKKMSPMSRLFIEIPHARNYLLMNVDCPAFKNDTFWSEHLVLHTRTSVEKVLNLAGFDYISVAGHQRYGLGNLIQYLDKGLPNGDKHLPNWGNADGLSYAFESCLAKIDATDTLWIDAYVE